MADNKISISLEESYGAEVIYYYGGSSRKWVQLSQMMMADNEASALQSRNPCSADEAGVLVCLVPSNITPPRILTIIRPRIKSPKKPPTPQLQMLQNSLVLVPTCCLSLHSITYPKI